MEDSTLDKLMNAGKAVGGEKFERRVFLGGTCGKSTWRSKLIPMLRCDYFNPVVEEWTAECQQREIYERENDEFILYVLTNEMTGVYSIAEVTDDSNKRPQRTILYIDKDGFDNFMLKSLAAVEKMVKGNGATVLYSLEEVADYLNNIYSRE